MKLAVGLTILIGVVSAPAMAGADVYDMKWISQCIRDNADAKVAPEVVTRYCTCMNNLMDSNESRSISQWEKTHPDEMKACDREAGWVK